MPTIGPVVEQLPTAPNRGMSSSTYPIIADAWAAKIGPWTIQVNAVTTWMGQKVDLILGAQDAAALSATGAADSATLAGQKVGQAAAQVDLAVTARQGAESAQASTAALAAAVAAGALPPFVDGLDVLQAKPDKTGVQWGKVGQAVGDVLVTSRIPNATYVLPDTVYTRAAYPDLFAIIGTQGENNDGASWSTVSNGLSGTPAYPTAIVYGKDDVVISVNGTGAGATRSTNGGLNWTPISAANGPNSIGANFIATDSQGVWIATGLNSANCSRSTDNGITWAIVAPGMGVNCSAIATDKLGNWLMGSTQGNMSAKSTNNGVSWVIINNAQAGALPTGTVFALECDGTSWVADVGAPTPFIARSFGARFERMMYKVYMTNAMAHYSLVVRKDFIAFYSSDAGLFISQDGGFNFKSIDSVQPGFLTMTGDTLIGIDATGAIPRLFKSTDKGDTWTFSPLISSNTYQVYPNGSGPNGQIVAVTGNPAIFSRSIRLYNYDVATQFKTPAHKAPKGFKAYIKGKLL